MKLHELKLSGFIDCAVDGNYAALDSPEDWADIQHEWAAIVGDLESAYLIRLIQEIILIDSKMVKAATLFSIFEKIQDARLLDEIAMLGVPILEDAKDKVEKFLMYCDGYYKQWGVLLDQKKSELELMQKKEGGAPINRLYFDQLIIEVSKHVGYQVQEDVISAQKFALMLKQIKDYKPQSTNSK